MRREGRDIISVENMAIGQYGIDISTVSDEQVQLWMSFVSEDRRIRAEKYKFREDAKRCILAEILVLYAIGKYFHADMSDIEFDKLQYGKPVIKNHEEWYFNLSHSGKWVVCAVNNRPVGIDVEEMNIMCIDIANRFFTTHENERIKACLCEQDRVKEFFKLWTLKESYIKRSGQGLRKRLDSFEFYLIEGREIVFDNFDRCDECNFFSFFLDEKHIVSLCCESAEVGDMQVLDGKTLGKDIGWWKSRNEIN